jgi:hypothetical protein
MNRHLWLVRSKAPLALFVLGALGCAGTPLRNAASAINAVQDPEGEAMARVAAYSKGEYGTDSLRGFIQFREDMLVSGAGPNEMSAMGSDAPDVLARWEVLKRAGGATDQDIAKAKALASKMGSSPQFFSRNIEEAGYNDGKQASYFLFVLMIVGAAGQGMAQAQANNSGGGAGYQHRSSESGHVAAHPTVSHTGAVSHAPTGVHASVSAHVGASPQVGGAVHTEHEEPGHLNAHPESAEHAEHEHRHEHRPHLKPPNVEVRVNGRIRTAGSVRIVVVPGVVLPVATFLGLGADETSACDDAGQQAMDLNACVTDPGELETSECTCATMTDAAGQRQVLCSVGASMMCQAGVALPPPQ